eukprot:196152_1
MRYNRVNGFLSLGVILYLSTFPLGKAQTNCTEQYDVCGSDQPDCCEGLTCFTDSNNKSACQPCTTENNQCGSDQPDCCEGLTCFTYNSTTSTCQNCTAAYDICSTDEDAKSCCGTLTC